MIRLSCLSLSFQNQFRQGRMDMFSFIKYARSLNLDGMDPHFQHLVRLDRLYLKQIRRAALDNGLTIASMPVSTEFGRDAARVPAEIEKARVAMEAGMYLGAPILRVFVGSAPSPDKTEEAFKRGVDALHRCAEIGADLGIVVALQNHSGLTSTGDDMLRFYKAVNHPNFTLLLDTGHFTGRDGPNGPKMEGHTYDNYYKSLEQVAPIAPFVRVKLYEVDQSGRERYIDYDRVFNILRGVHYNNFVSLVYEGKEDEMSAIPRGVNFLRKKVQGL